MTHPINDLSNDARMVAYALFSFGEKAKVNFDRAHVIHPRTRAGLDELAEHGFIVPLVAHTGAAAWKGTENLGRPMFDVENPKELDSFPITTGE